MNEKLKCILHAAWNDPRHFFFWLTMFGVLGFIAIAVCVSLGGPIAVFAFAALGCILGVVLGIPAFILAWIPPCRRLFERLLGRRWLALGCLVALVAVFYAIEDWRGRHAWQSFKSQREAKGERLDWASLVPPPVPKEQNFFETRLWDDLRSETVPEGDTGESRFVFSACGPYEQFLPSMGNWAKEQRVNLADWQGFYRGSTNAILAADRAASLAGLKRTLPEAFIKRYHLDTAPASPPTNYFPVAKEAQAPAADVLLALSRFETNRQLLVASSTRPYARFWIDYDARFNRQLPHLARIEACARYLSLHANAALKVGDRKTALEDVALLFHLMAAPRSEPILISQLDRIPVLHIGLQPVWEGLADRQWSEADLQVIEVELGKLDYLADYQFAMRGERACIVWAVDYARRRGLDALGETGDPENSSKPAEVEKVVSRMLYQLVPAGWFEQNKLSLCRNNESYLLPAEDQERRIISPPIAQQLEAAIGKLRMSPYDVLSRMLMPAFASCAEKFARAQNSVDLACVACALERYRLVNGQFPDTLDALAPKFIAKLPHDVINGQPLKYRRTDDGQFVLRSGPHCLDHETQKLS